MHEKGSPSTTCTNSFFEWLAVTNYRHWFSNERITNDDFCFEDQSQSLTILCWSLPMRKESIISQALTFVSYMYVGNMQLKTLAIVYKVKPISRLAVKKS